MRIAVVAWGSLIWNIGCLRIRTSWRTDGPLLPIEFARISNGGRLTLVIHPGAKPQRTYWAISDLSDLTRARMNLQEREKCISLDPIHFCSLTTAVPRVQSEVLSSLRKWLSAQPEIDAIIWTGLTQNWRDKFPTDFSADGAVDYLEDLEAQRALDETKFKRAKEYVTKAPPSIQTEVRTRMREKGWSDEQLPSVLFEEGRTLMQQVQICQGFGDKDWQRLSKELLGGGNEAAWQRAIDIFKRRMDERFFSCIRALEAVEGPDHPYKPILDTDVDPARELPEKETTKATTGFAITAICCLLIETLQLFRVDGESGTNKAFQAFVTDCLPFDPARASDFSKGIRNGLFHQAETRGWLIRALSPEDPIVMGENLPYTLNRKRLFLELTRYFATYLSQLRDPTQNDLRTRFKERMDKIAARCRTI